LQLINKRVETKCQCLRGRCGRINANFAKHKMHFGDATSNLLCHCVINCRSNALQTISQSQWPKVGLIND